MANAKHVFISHAAEDKDEAAQLAAQLEERGVRVWLAPRDVRPGQDYYEQVDAAITGSAATIVYVSRSAARSASLRGEAELAASAGRPMFAVVGEEMPGNDGLPILAGVTHWTNIFGKNAERSLTRLAEELQALQSEAGAAAAGFHDAQQLQPPAAGTPPPPPPPPPPPHPSPPASGWSQTAPRAQPSSAGWPQSPPPAPGGWPEPQRPSAPEQPSPPPAPPWSSWGSAQPQGGAGGWPPAPAAGAAAAAGWGATPPTPGGNWNAPPPQGQGGGGWGGSAPPGAQGWGAPQAPGGYGQMAPPGDEREQLWRSFIGPNSEKFIPGWRQMDSGGSKISWIWPAFFFSVFWFAYRKLWLYAGIYAVALLALNIGVRSLVGGVLGMLVILIVPVAAGLLGSSFLKQRADAVLAQAQAQHADPHARMTTVAAAGGVSMPAMLAVLVAWAGLIYLLSSTGVLAGNSGQSSYSSSYSSGLGNTSGALKSYTVEPTASGGTSRVMDGNGSVTAEWLQGTWGPTCPGSSANSFTLYRDGSSYSSQGSGRWNVSGNTVTNTINGRLETSVWTYRNATSASVTVPGLGSGILYKC